MGGGGQTLGMIGPMCSTTTLEKMRTQPCVSLLICLLNPVEPQLRIYQVNYSLGDTPIQTKKINEQQPELH